MFLRRPEVASVVVKALKHGSIIELYDLRAFVIMGNHVHVLFLPRQQMSGVLQWLKGTTARQANQLLGRMGQPFWQRESYDHVVRDEHQLHRIAAYIENNPVVAGLVAEASRYRWSSAWRTEPAN
jgi:REP element-mobilizing transposase RayT